MYHHTAGVSQVRTMTARSTAGLFMNKEGLVTTCGRGFGYLEFMLYFRSLAFCAFPLSSYSRSRFAYLWPMANPRRRREIGE